MCNIKEWKTFPIISRKHDGSLHRKWEKNILLYRDNERLIGGNFRTIVTEHDGKSWRTTEPAIFYFHETYWFNIILILQQKNYYYYCNLSSPFTYRHDSLTYIDYDIDVIVQPDGTYEVVDREEYEKHRVLYRYPTNVQMKIELGLTQLIEKIKSQQDPFNKPFYETWAEKFTPYMRANK